MKYGGEIREYETDRCILLKYESCITLIINKNGRNIQIACRDEDLLESLLYCFNSGIIISMFFRKKMILHGSSFEYKKHIHALIGDSGVGKSTLLLSLLLNGRYYGIRAYADDIVTIDSMCRSNSNGMLPYKVCHDMINLANELVSEKYDIIEGLNKYWINFYPTLLVDDSLTLSTIFVLKPHYDDNTDITIEPLSILEIVEELTSKIHAFWCLPYEIKKDVIQQLDKIIKQVQVVKISYKKNLNMLRSVTDSVIKYIDSHIS